MTLTSIERLRQCLRAGTPPAELISHELPELPDAEYAAQRALLAWQQTAVFGPDAAVLVRQAVRWCAGSRLFTGAVAAALRPELDRAGLAHCADGTLVAEPYRPDWLRESVDCDAPPEPRIWDESLPAEPYLHSLHFQKWRSPAQKEAAWAALTTLPGATRIVVLPTGSGKSLCFQLLPRFDTGLTVVVVPTVALAIDQTRGARRAFAGYAEVNPIFFSSDDDPETAVRLVKERATRLIFTSPEACVSGRLRKVLDRMAEEGWLANLVVDEAHLVETWGAQFRVEFQILAALRRQWLTASGGQLRTFLFSATMTQACRQLLLELFAEPGAGSEFVSRRLRPEMVYFQRLFEGEARDAALFAALWRLPRPLILYVTEVDEARRYAHALRDAPHGFSRVACFHGETRRTERRQLLVQWQRNEIDVMVATSAFGVGVDKADVRAVVHACFPENLDRYYQEVGRGGRDGWSSLCLFLPTAKDRQVAGGLKVRLMGQEKIQERWDALYSQRIAEEDRGYSYLLKVDACRRGLVGRFLYGENVRWNKRLLLQLHRAGLAEIQDLKFNPPEPVEGGDDPEEFARVLVHFPPSDRQLGERMEPILREERQRFDRGFAQLEELLKGTHCVSRVLGDLYDIDDRERICGGCPACRAHHRTPDACPPLGFDPASAGEHRGTLVLNWPDALVPAQRDDSLDAMRNTLRRKQARRFLVPTPHFAKVLALMGEVLPGQSNERYRIDPYGATTIIATPPEETLHFLHLGALSPAAFDLGRGRRAVHLCARGVSTVDENDRGAHVWENCARFHSPDAWFHA